MCFLDYSDFFAFNFGDPELLITSDAPRPPLDVGEATRIIMMKVNVTSVEEPGPEDGQELPVVHFRGVSRSLDDEFDNNANSNIRGKQSVSLPKSKVEKVQPELTWKHSTSKALLA